MDFQEDLKKAIFVWRQRLRFITPHWRVKMWRTQISYMYMLKNEDYHFQSLLKMKIAFSKLKSKLCAGSLTILSDWLLYTDLYELSFHSGTTTFAYLYHIHIFYIIVGNTKIEKSIWRSSIKYTFSCIIIYNSKVLRTWMLYYYNGVRQLRAQTKLTIDVSRF